ncbi:hypothetical protein TYRP_018392, partial [Tyrophagus putrescentiae]
SAGSTLKSELFQNSRKAQFDFLQGKSHSNTENKIRCDYQLRGPLPKGKKVYGTSLCLFSGRNRSG